MSKGFTCQGCGNLFLQDPKCVTCGAQKLYDSTVKMQGKQIETQAAEITRLRAELATARREGMEEAAQIAEKCYRQNGPLSQRGFPERYRAGLAAGAQAIAAAIRAAAEEVK